jgi:hypothetical protein
MNTDVIQPETQTSHSLNTTSSYNNNPTTSKNSHSLNIDSTQNYTDPQNSFDKFNQSVQKELDQLQNSTPPPHSNYQNIINTNDHHKDIRSQEPVNEHEKIVEFSNKLENCYNDAKMLIELFIEIKADKKGFPRKELNAIFTKIHHKDRAFFRTFTKIDQIKCPHQIEYEKIENAFHENYKKASNVSYLNRSTKKKAKVIINRSLFIAYLRSTNLNDLKYQQVAQLIEYGLNYFIDPTAEKVNYQELLSLCAEEFYNNLPNLPNDPDLIPSNIKIRLPHIIPITDRNTTYEVVQILRVYYKFDLLPNSFFVIKPDLPNNPQELRTEVKNAFPITDRKALRSLRNYADSLREYYTVPSKLPDSYFNLPKPLPKLPTSYYDLPTHLAKLFPVYNNSHDIKQAINELRKEFQVSYLPLDFIQTKQPLPKPSQIEDELGTFLPINDQDEVWTFLDSLNKKYYFNTPLEPNWIASNLQQNHNPILPNNLEQIANEFGFCGKIKKDASNFGQLIKKIKQKYQFSKLPEDWLESDTPDLPPLEEAIQILSEKNSHLTLPLIDNPNLSRDINDLKKIFFFEKLPDEYISEEVLPDPRIEHLPTLL